MSRSSNWEKKKNQQHIDFYFLKQQLWQIEKKGRPVNQQIF